MRTRTERRLLSHPVAPPGTPLETIARSGNIPNQLNMPIHLKRYAQPDALVGAAALCRYSMSAGLPARSKWEVIVTLGAATFGTLLASAAFAPIP